MSPHTPGDTTDSDADDEEWEYGPGAGVDEQEPSSDLSPRAAGASIVGGILVGFTLAMFILGYMQWAVAYMGLLVLLTLGWHGLSLLAGVAGGE